MSGIETAGLVLGALPLIIAGIEKYNEGLDPIKAFYSWEKELPKYIHKLRLQHVHYEQTLRLLFAPIATEAELVDMIANPIGGWTDDIMAEKLRLRLDEAYDAYQSTIADIEKITVKIASKLDLERATSKVTRSELEAMLIANPLQSDHKYYFRKRARFGMSKKKIKSLLDDFDECNKQLERFTDKSDKLETYRRSCKPSFTQKVLRIQTYAKSLHSVLTWRCACSSSHSANLQLEQRLESGKRSKDLEIPTDSRFSVSFWSTCSPWSWQEARIDMWVDTEESGPRTLTPCPTLSPKPIFNKKLFRGVSFDTTPSTPSSSLSRASTLVSTSENHVLEDVSDMCAVIHKHHATASCIGFSLDVQGKLRGAIPVPDVKQKALVLCDMVSLDTLLNRPSMHSGIRSALTKKDRYGLAVILASSALQLYATPWISDQWSKKDILFQRVSSGNQPVDVEHPYVKHNTEPAVSSPGKPTSPKNTILLALAVTLLELYFGKPCEQVQLSGSQSNLNSPTPWTLLAMTSEWVSREEDNLSHAFATAVKSCLQLFHDPTNSLVEPQSLKAAIEGIVLPLQEEFWQFTGKTGL